MEHRLRMNTFTTALLLCTMAAPCVSLIVEPLAAKPSLAPAVSTSERADKLIVITDTTRSVNVFKNDTVMFKVGDKQFTIKFSGNNVYYDLSTLAPRGMLDRKVSAYVVANPRDHK